MSLPPHVIFIQQLRVSRRKAGVTQRQLATEMTRAGFSMHQTTVAKIEAGERPVSLGEAIHLAGVLGIDLSALIAGHQSPAPVAGPYAAVEEFRRALSQWIRDYQPEAFA